MNVVTHQSSRVTAQMQAQETGRGELRGGANKKGE